ncbi:MAG TPA: SAM-dependent methyltransferase, partial [Pseudonocardiaceae bacterium]|nr:SAM-dependent methyltransferase [Pseudonocardiaceae bacterium]
EQLPDWVPEGMEVTMPNAARMYDYALGGYHNFAVDREFAAQVEAAAPGSTAIAHANRAFVGRSVRWLVDAGIRQFLDVGSGIPTLGNVHEVAQAAAPESKVIYVDIDPIAIAHSRAILAGNPLAEVLQADLRRPADILYHEDVVRLLDFAQPVAVLLNAVLHFVPDDADPEGILAEIKDTLVSGSYLVLTHGTEIGDRPGEAEAVVKLYRQTPTAVMGRGPERIRNFLTGLELVEPGIVPVNEWRPDPEARQDSVAPAILAAVGRKS